jgi:hypothetical protein
VSVVLADPEGFAVDWDWQRGLTVWAVAGPRSGSRFGTRVLDHQLPARPASEGRARRAARRWWWAQGRAQARSTAEATPGDLSDNA